MRARLPVRPDADDVESAVDAALDLLGRALLRRGGGGVGRPPRSEDEEELVAEACLAAVALLRVRTHDLAEQVRCLPPRPCG